MTWTLAQSTRARVSPKEKAKAAKEKAVSHKTDRECLVCGKAEHFATDCDHRVRTVNEVTKTVPVSVIAESGHSLSHVYNQNTSVRHDWIPALTVDIHSCSRYTASNMKPMVDFWSSNACLSQLVHFFISFCIRETIVTQK